MQVCHHRDITVLSETSTKRSISVAETIDLKVHLEINTKCTGCKMMSPSSVIEGHTQLQLLPPLSPMKGRAVTFLSAKEKMLQFCKWVLWLFSLTKECMVFWHEMRLVSVVSEQAFGKASLKKLQKENVFQTTDNAIVGHIAVYCQTEKVMFLTAK